MSTVVFIHCDCRNDYGTCANRSLPGHTIDEARQAATDAGWSLGRAQDRCPGHTGRRTTR